MWVRWVVFFIGTILGVLMVWKTEGFLSFTGRIDFAEKYLGTEGGTRIFLKLLGVVVIIVSWMIAFNVGEIILRRLFLPTVPEGQ